MENQLLPMQQIPLSTQLVGPRERQMSIQLGTNGVAGVAGVTLKSTSNRLRDSVSGFVLGFTPLAFHMSVYSRKAAEV